MKLRINVEEQSSVDHKDECKEIEINLILSYLNEEKNNSIEVLLKKKSLCERLINLYTYQKYESDPKYESDIIEEKVKKVIILYLPILDEISKYYLNEYKTKNNLYSLDKCFECLCIKEEVIIDHDQVDSNFNNMMFHVSYSLAVEKFRLILSKVFSDPKEEQRKVLDINKKCFEKSLKYCKQVLPNSSIKISFPLSYLCYIMYNISEEENKKEKYFKESFQYIKLITEYITNFYINNPNINKKAFLDIINLCVCALEIFKNNNLNEACNKILNLDENELYENITAASNSDHDSMNAIELYRSFAQLYDGIFYIFQEKNHIEILQEKENLYKKLIDFYINQKYKSDIVADALAVLYLPILNEISKYYFNEYKTNNELYNLKKCFEYLCIKEGVLTKFSQVDSDFNNIMFHVSYSLSVEKFRLIFDESFSNNKKEQFKALNINKEYFRKSLEYCKQVSPNSSIKISFFLSYLYYRMYSISEEKKEKEKYFNESFKYIKLITENITNFYVNNPNINKKAFLYIINLCVFALEIFKDNNLNQACNKILNLDENKLYKNINAANKSDHDSMNTIKLKLYMSFAQLCYIIFYIFKDNEFLFMAKFNLDLLKSKLFNNTESKLLNIKLEYYYLTAKVYYNLYVSDRKEEYLKNISVNLDLLKDIVQKDQQSSILAYFFVGQMYYYLYSYTKNKDYTGQALKNLNSVKCTLYKGNQAVLLIKKYYLLGKIHYELYCIDHNNAKYLKDAIDNLQSLERVLILDNIPQSLAKECYLLLSKIYYKLHLLTKKNEYLVNAIYNLNSLEKRLNVDNNGKISDPLAKIYYFLKGQVYYELYVLNRKEKTNIVASYDNFILASELGSIKALEHAKILDKCFIKSQKTSTSGTEQKNTKSDSNNKCFSLSEGSNNVRVIM